MCSAIESGDFSELEVNVGRALNMESCLVQRETNKVHLDDDHVVQTSPIYTQRYESALDCDHI